MEKQYKKQIKKEYNKVGVMLLLQQIAMMAIVILCMVVRIVGNVMHNPNFDFDLFFKQYNDRALGTDMLISVVLAFVIILLFRGKKFFINDLVTKNRDYTLKVILAAAVFTLTVNFVMFQSVMLLEKGLNLFHFTLQGAMESLDSKLTFSMVFYTCIIGPLFEEFIYRGAVLRSLEKYGQGFAIVCSGLLFGFMHGNIVQIPICVVIGIILGWMAVTYSIRFTIIIHIINNVISVLYTYAGNHVSNHIVETVYLIVMASCLVLTLFFIYKNRKKLKEFIGIKKTEKGYFPLFFCSVWIVLLLLFDFVQAITGISALS